MANKVDLETNGQRRVSTEEGRDLAKKIGCPFIETSAAHRSHVDDVFHTLVREIRRHQVIHSLEKTRILLENYFVKSTFSATLFKIS